MKVRQRAEAPGVIRLRAMDAKPRLPSARAVVAAVVALPVVRKPRPARRVEPKQAALL